MNRLSLLFLLCIAGILLIFGCSQPDSYDSDKDDFRNASTVTEIQVGAAKIDITPDFLNQQVVLASKYKVKIASGFLDPVYVRAIVIKSGNTKIGIVSIEQLYITSDLYKSVFENINDLNLTGLIIQATCTQSSEGQFDNNLIAQKTQTGTFQSACFEKRIIAIENALRIADETAQDAVMVYEITEAMLELDDRKISYKTHNNNADSQNDEIQRVMFFSMENHNLIAQMLSFSVFPQILPDDYSKISGDFTGKLSSLAETEYPHTIAIASPSIISDSKFNHEYVNVLKSDRSPEEVLNVYSQRFYRSFFSRTELNTKIDYENTWQYLTHEENDPTKLDTKGFFTFKKISDKIQIFSIGNVIYFASSNQLSNNQIKEFKDIASDFNFSNFIGLSACNSNQDADFGKKNSDEIKKTLASMLIPD